MKNRTRYYYTLVLALLAFLALMTTSKVEAKTKNIKDNNQIANGVSIGGVDVSGMSYNQALEAVSTYVNDISETEITLEVADSNKVVVKSSEFGICWENEAVVQDALDLGKSGNVIKRYKELEDIKHGGLDLNLEIGYDAAMVLEVLENKCQIYDVDAVDFSLSRDENGFSINEGAEGYALNVEEAFSILEDYLSTKGYNENTSISLPIEVAEPRGSESELSVVTDILGTYTTSYSTSSKERTANVENGCRLINGITLYPGDEFSTLAAITPFSEENGYMLAASYLNGLVVESLGGGICQVSTTLYNAVLLSELKTTSRSCHSMIVSYVKPSMDAAIAESSGKDFKFVNNTDYPIYVEGITKDRKITFNIYGVETRDPGHKVSFESEVLSTTEPSADKIITDSSKPAGYINVSAAHTGYKAQLWRIVTENGVETSREVINKSTYNMSPRTATVGISTNNAEYLSMLNQAIATGSIDNVKAAANQISLLQSLNQ